MPKKSTSRNSKGKRPHKRKTYPYKPFPCIPNVFAQIWNTPPDHIRIPIDDIFSITATGYCLIIKGNFYWFSKKDVQLSQAAQEGPELIISRIKASEYHLG